jgi:hypothetical protein
MGAAHSADPFDVDALMASACTWLFEHRYLILPARRLPQVAVAPRRKHEAIRLGRIEASISAEVARIAGHQRRPTSGVPSSPEAFGDPHPDDAAERHGKSCEEEENAAPLLTASMADPAAEASAVGNSRQKRHLGQQGTCHGAVSAMGHHQGNLAHDGIIRALCCRTMTGPGIEVTDATSRGRQSERALRIAARSIAGCRRPKCQWFIRVPPEDGRRQTRGP